MPAASPLTLVWCSVLLCETGAHDVRFRHGAP